MLKGVQAILTLVCIVSSHPVKQSDSQSEKIIFVPYDVKFVPVEIPALAAGAQSPVENEKFGSHVTLENTKPFVLPPLEKVITSQENSGEYSSSMDGVKQFQDKDKEIAYDLFQDKFDFDKSKSPEDYVLLPVSIVKNLESQKEGDSLSKTHIIAKRQAPGANVLEYRPIVQFTKLLRNRRRVVRPPGLVGYLNDYDHFPTVA